jgi:hypothetical protein
MGAYDVVNVRPLEVIGEDVNRISAEKRNASAVKKLIPILLELNCRGSLAGFPE